MPVSRTSWLMRLRGAVLHLLRIGIVLAVFALLHIQSQRVRETAPATRPALSLAQIRQCVPEAAELGQVGVDNGVLPIFDANGGKLGYAVTTLPQAAAVQGFSGPTNALLVFTTRDELACIEILASADNPEYVRLVERDAEFANALLGRTWDQLAELNDVDAVSGATLTSLAIAEGVALRVGGQRPSLRFPEPPRVEELIAFLPAAHSLSEDERQRGLWRVTDRDGVTVGYALRTSPAADDLIGYQGPTDVLVALDTEQAVIGMRIRDTFDHQRYVQYVRDDEYFMTFFNGMSLQELEELDIDQSQVEGVSGATMTSLTIAEALKRAASQVQTRTISKVPDTQTVIDWQHAWPTVCIIGLAVALAFSRWRRFRSVRLVLQIAVIVQLGFVTGNMVSLAVLGGWAQSGIPWQTQLIQCLLVGAALLVPAVTKRQVYCNSLCPFGAVQQLLLPISPRSVHLGSRTTRLLSSVPWLLLLLAIAVVALRLPVSLVDLEPFGAFVLRAATWGTVGIALVGLAVSWAVPMAYCRFGCPTGAILSFLRRHGRSHELGLRDAAALLCLLLAAILTIAT